ncbi:MAG: DUF3794 domain-containing protein, partial [Clostridium sp.]|nr:DUF3794 domain-containing protein [Clostridium sp.]
MLHKKEIKIADDKVYVGCYCKVNVLYKGDDCKDVVSLEDDVYLSKEHEMGGITADMTPSVSFELVNNELMLEEDDLGEVRIINTEFAVKAHVKIFSKENIDVIKDAYSPDCLLDLKKDEHEVGVLQGINNTESVIKDNIQLTDTDLKPDLIISAGANVIITDKELAQDKVIVEGIIKADILYKTSDEDKYLSVIKSEIPFSTMIDIAGAKEGMNAIIRAGLENIEAAIEGNTIAIKATLCLSGKILYEISKEFICDVVEEEGEKPEKKASITIYVVGQGDTLWGLAKKYSTTVEQLKSINGIEDTDYIESGQKLIIPGRAIF